MLMFLLSIFLWTRIWSELFIVLFWTSLFSHRLWKCFVVVWNGLALSWGEQLVSLHSRPLLLLGLTSSIVLAQPLCCSLTLGLVGLGRCLHRDRINDKQSVEERRCLMELADSSAQRHFLNRQWANHSSRGEASYFLGQPSAKCLSTKDLHVIRCFYPLMILCVSPGRFKSWLGLCCGWHLARSWV